MATEDDPISERDPVCTTLRESLVRKFSCACCRRVWLLTNDERVCRAIEVAERNAEADGTLEARDNAGAQVTDAIKNRAREEWEAEAEAHFHYTPSQCEIAARLYATIATWYTLSRTMSNPDPDPHPARPDPRKPSSWFWVASAVETVARSDVRRHLEDVGVNDCSKFTRVGATAQLGRIAEHHEQRRFFRRMVSTWGSAGRPVGGQQA
jgi:hypothetical protein